MVCEAAVAFLRLSSLTQDSRILRSSFAPWDPWGAVTRVTVMLTARQVCCVSTDAYGRFQQIFLVGNEVCLAITIHRGQDTREITLLEHKIFNVVSRSSSPVKSREGCCCSHSCPPLSATVNSDEFSRIPKCGPPSCGLAEKNMPTANSADNISNSFCQSSPASLLLEQQFFFIWLAGAVRAPHP